MTTPTTLAGDYLITITYRSLTIGMSSVVTSGVPAAARPQGSGVVRAVRQGVRGVGAGAAGALLTGAAGAAEAGDVHVPAGDLLAVFVSDSWIADQVHCKEQERE